MKQQKKMNSADHLSALQSASVEAKQLRHWSRPPLRIDDSVQVLCVNGTRLEHGVVKGCDHDGLVVIELGTEEDIRIERIPPDNVFIYPCLPDPGYHLQKYQTALGLLVARRWSMDAATKLWE